MQYAIFMDNQIYQSRINYLKTVSLMVFIVQLLLQQILVGSYPLEYYQEITVPCGLIYIKLC